MATWKKSPPELIAAFDVALASQPQAERRKMFGYPCAFVNGNMAVGLHEDRVIARVPDEAARWPCVILGRRMKDYAAVDFDSAMQVAALQGWVARAVAHTATLPAKAAKKAAAAVKPAKPAKAARATKTAQTPKIAKTAKTSKSAPATPKARAPKAATAPRAAKAAAPVKKAPAAPARERSAPSAARAGKAAARAKRAR